MRLTCPNCDAQYEIDASLIPPAGRDVQCSNCGKTWFQEPEGGLAMPETEPEASEPEAADEAPAMAQDAPDNEVENAAEVPDEDTEEQASVSEDDTDEIQSGLTAEAAAFFGKSDAKPTAADNYDEEPEGKVEAAEPAMPSVSEDEPGGEDAAPAEPEPEEAEADEEDDEPAELPRREMDPEVRGILREEAERELAARRAEAQAALETQPELGLETVAAGAAARTARLRGDPEPEAPKPEARKSMLPDIEEINSTLTAESDRIDRIVTQEMIEDTRRQRGGFRIGFLTVFGLALALILLYVLAPTIAGMAPGLEPALAGYVDWANGVRLAIDGWLRGLFGG